MVLFVVTWQGIWIGKVAERAMLTCSAGNLGMLSVSRIRVFFPSYREKACSGSCMMASWTGFCSKLIMQKACKGNKRSAVWCKLHGLGNVEKICLHQSVALVAKCQNISLVPKWQMSVRPQVQGNMSGFLYGGLRHTIWSLGRSGRYPLEELVHMVKRRSM